MGHFSHLIMLLLAGMALHGLFWARNTVFLWSLRATILKVVLLAELWQLIASPIGGLWGAWHFSSDRVLGVWLAEGMPIEDILGIAVVSSAAACGVLVFGYGPKREI
jgi:hypothetical protein